jgi:hypothetical protein
MGYGNGRPRVKGDYAEKCAYCGAKWFRSELKRDGSGKLYCPDEGDGLDTVTLGKIQQQNAQEAMHRPAYKRRDLL